MSFDGEIHLDPYSGKYKRSPTPRRFGPCACGCLILALVGIAGVCLLVGTLLGLGAGEVINNRDAMLPTQLAQALTETALARPPATGVVVQPPTLPPSVTPSATHTATVTPRPSQTLRPTDIPPSATPTLTAIPRTIIAPTEDGSSMLDFTQGQVLWSGDLIAVSGGDTIQLLDANALGRDGTSVNISSDIQDIAINVDGTLLAAAGADGAVILWDVHDPTQPERLAKLTVSTGPVWSVAFDPQNRWLVAGTDDGKIRMWQVQDLTQLATQSVQNGPIFALAFDHEGNRLAVGGGQQVVLLDVQSDGSLQPNQTISVAGETLQAVFSPDGVYLSLATRHGLELWKLNPNKRIALDRHQNRINDVVFSDDGLVLASGGTDNTAQLWIMADVQIVAWHILLHDSPVVSMAMNSDATRLITLTQANTLTVWDIPTGTTLKKRQL